MSETSSASGPSRDASDSPTEKPRNGRRGLRHWRHDLIAGLVVSFVSLPLSSGIAIASGAPPIYGIISAIIGGLVFPFVGGSYVTISGPAAGLAPALLAIMVSLGGAGTADHVGSGYPLLLAVIAVVGVVQILLARFGLARFAAVFPASVVEGMLGAIGVLILVKALPLAFGYQGAIHAHGFAEYLVEIPEWFAHGDHSAMWVAAISLVPMALFSHRLAKKVALFRTLPPHVFAVLFGVAASMAFGLAESLRIQCPDNPLGSVQAPAFGELFARPELWSAALIGVLTLTLIDGVESLATGQAIDRIDPFRRRSKPNRLLGAMGVSNLVSALVGGLTVIPGGVKSKTNIEAGGRTLWSNFYLAGFLTLYVFAVPGVIGAIPKATLGAILVYTGWKMVHPRIVRHLAHIGTEQVAFYAITLVTTLLTDLLVGIAVGTATKLAFVTVLAARHQRTASPRSLVRILGSMFRDPVASESTEHGRTRYEVQGPLVCFNSFRLLERLERDQSISRKDHQDVEIVIGDRVPLIDHTAVDGVFSAMDEATEQPLVVTGLDPLRARGREPRSMRLRTIEPTATGG